MASLVPVKKIGSSNTCISETDVTVTSSLTKTTSYRSPRRSSVQKSYRMWDASACGWSQPFVKTLLIVGTNKAGLKSPSAVPSPRQPLFDHGLTLQASFFLRTSVLHVFIRDKTTPRLLPRFLAGLLDVLKPSDVTQIFHCRPSSDDHHCSEFSNGIQCFQAELCLLKFLQFETQEKPLSIQHWRSLGLQATPTQQTYAERQLLEICCAASLCASVFLR